MRGTRWVCAILALPFLATGFTADLPIQKSLGSRTTAGGAHHNKLSPVPPQVAHLPTSRWNGHYFSRKAAYGSLHALVGQSTDASSSPAVLLSLLSSPIGAVTILAAIVLVHEMGHYLAARSFGVTVEEFSIGFGPKLTGFKAFGHEFNLRALPLGGYVRFPENYNATEVQLRQRERMDAKEKAQEQQVSLGIRSVIANMLTFGAREKKRRRDEKRLREGNVEIEYYDDPNLLQNRPWFQRAIVLSGGVVFNLLLSYSIYFGQITVGPGLPQPIFDAGVVVSASPRPEAAAAGLLRKGDVIVQINGKPVTTSTSPTPFEARRAIDDVISTIRATADGDSILLSVVHANTKKAVDVSIQPTHLTSAKAPLSLGILLSPNFVRGDVLKTSNLLEAASLARTYLVVLTQETADGLFSLARSAFMGNSNAGSQVSGPIGLIRTGSEIVSTKDWTSVLLFSAAISINLGVVNSIPLPALDGGQLLFVLAEAVTGRKVNQRVQENITGVTVLLLLLFSVGAAIGDIESLFGF